MRSKKAKQSKQTLQELNLLDRFLFAEASGSERIQTLHTKIEAIRNNEEIGVKFMNAYEEKMLERQAGFEEGEASGLKAGEQKGELTSIINLMKNKNWTRKEAMDALGIPTEKRAGYIERLDFMQKNA